MNLDGFLRERGESWSELEQLVREARGRADRLGDERLLRLASLYREASADLALVRRRFPTDPVRTRLEDLVARAALAVYGSGHGRRSFVRAFTRDYWREIAARPVPLGLAALLLLAPAVLAGSWAAGDPTGAAAFIPDDFQGAIDPPADSGAGASQRAVFTAELFTNNIRVTFLAFALGIAAGIGTAAILVMNGLFLGAVAGAAIEAGNGGAFLEFVIPHGPLELSCIAVAGAAGLRLGWSWVAPGDATRRAALAAEGRRSVVIVLGTMPWLVAAGIVEAFVRSAGLPAFVTIGVGLGLLAAFWGLVWIRGRGAGAVSPAPAPAAKAAPAPSP